MMNAPDAVSCRNLSKSYGRTPAVDHVSFSIPAGEILALVGPSGCGKTTILRLVAGFERPERGSIALAGEPVSEPGVHTPPEDRNVGMVFQDLALFTHLTVFENVSFGLQRHSRRAARERVAEMLALVGLEGKSDRLPQQLSGGERQRVALARALAPRPVVLLLDEPLSSLDADLRLKMRFDMRRLIKDLGMTTIFVTHDQDEALFMGDRVALMKAGRMVQIGAPECLYQAPESRFVAEFMGAADFLPATVTPYGLQTEIGMLAQKTTWPVGEQLEVALRADDVTFKLDPQGDARVRARFFKGAYTVYQLQLASGSVVHAMHPHTSDIPQGTRVRVSADPGHDLACFRG